MENGPTDHVSENGNNISAHRGTVHSLEEDRRSVISKSSKAQSILKREGSQDVKIDDSQPISNLKQIGSPSVTHKKSSNKKNKITEEDNNEQYDKDEFETEVADREEKTSVLGKLKASQDYSQNHELTHSSPLQNLTTDASLH